MRTAIVIGMLGVVAGGGCGKKKAAPGATGAESGNGDAGTGSSAGSAGSGGSASSADAGGAVATACTPDGTYRLRFESNGSSGWWFRATVSGSTATLTEEVPVLAQKPGPLTVTASPASCQIVISRSTGDDTVGDLVFTLTEDPATHAVSGTMTRTADLEYNKASVPVDGMHDVGEPVAAQPCLARGVFALDVTAETWKPDSDGAGFDCESSGSFPEILVEPWGSRVAISTTTAHTGEDYSWRESRIHDVTDCKVSVDLRTDMSSLAGTLVLGPAITGTATKVSYEVVEDGEEGRGIWRCVATDVPVTGAPPSPSR
jgi:hypothetical protein